MKIKEKIVLIIRTIKQEEIDKESIEKIPKINLAPNQIRIRVLQMIHRLLISKRVLNQKIVSIIIIRKEVNINKVKNSKMIDRKIIKVINHIKIKTIQSRKYMLENRIKILLDMRIRVILMVTAITKKEEVIMMKDNNKNIATRKIEEKDNRNRIRKIIKVAKKINKNRSSTKKTRNSNKIIQIKLLINIKVIIFNKIKPQMLQLKKMLLSIHFSF